MRAFRGMPAPGVQVTREVEAVSRGRPSWRSLLRPVRPGLAVLTIAMVLLGIGASLVHAGPVRAAAAGPAPLDTAAVDGYVHDYLDRHGLAGAGVAVVKDGRVLHTAGYGESGGETAGARTPFAVGSVSKPFTAFAILQLVAAGEVRLDEPVTTYLPELEIGDDRASGITVRHLLSHTSGLPDPTIVPPAENLAEDIGHLDDWVLTADPGTSYRYSNYNYRIAARLVEVVSETTFESYLQREVFEPLSMVDSRSVTTRDGDLVLDQGHVTAYGLALPVREMDLMSAGSGGVVTTADDMARWLALQTDRGRTQEGGSLLPPHLLEESHTPQPGAERAGLGWMRSGSDVEPARISHSGSLTRFNAQIDLVPSSGYAVAVMLNSFTPTYEHAYAISSGIVEITEGGNPSPGAPVATLIDAALGTLTLLVVGLTLLGVRRYRRWAARRSGWSTWRYALRLLPALTFPALAGYVFLVLPELQNNSATALDAFFLWPAAMVLLVTLAASGAALVVARTHRRFTAPPKAQDTRQDEPAFA
jgi:CubicO group peptidase (beta-lactamase class C family)